MAMRPSRARISRLMWAVLRGRPRRAQWGRAAGAITSANTREAYEEVFGAANLLKEYLSPARRKFYDEIARVVADLRPRSLLDAGCGTGHLLRAVMDRIPPPERVVGIDQTQSGIAHLASMVPTAEAVVGDVFELPYENDTFDVVLCTEVLEHVHAPELLLAELVRVCRQSGTLVLTVPDGEVDEYEGHVNFWSAFEFAAFVGTAGEAEVTRLDGGDLLALVHTPGETSSSQRLVVHPSA